MPHKRVLVVDDETDILELVEYHLVREGYSVRLVETGESALEAVTRHPPDLVILDLMLPGLDGMEVCRRLKANSETRSIPVMMLTAKGEDSDIVSGLEVGADDYLSKPFSPRVLTARVRALLRRNSPEAESKLIRAGALAINTARHEVHVDGVPVELSATEFAILTTLARNPGWVFSRMQIIDSVKGKDYPVTERSVDVQILGLRRKLGKRAPRIETVRGVGYRLRSDST